MSLPRNGSARGAGRTSQASTNGHAARHRTLGVAIIGAGYWGPNLLRNFFSSERWTVEALVDVDEKRLTKPRRLYPGLRTFTDFEAVLNDERVDAVAVATPIESHYAIARAALEAGKHVLIEKPMCALSSEAQHLCAMADERGLVLMVDHTYLYTGAVRYLKQLVASQQLGRVFYMDAVRVNLGLFHPRYDVIFDLAPHDVSIMNYLMDAQPIEVAAVASYGVSAERADVAYLTLKYPSGILGHAHLSWLSPAKVRRLMISGTHRMAIWDDTEASEKVKVFDSGVDVSPDPESRYERLISYRTGDMIAPAISRTEALSQVVAAFWDSIVSHVPSPSTGYDGLAVLRVIEAAEQSLRANGAFVHIAGEANVS